MTSSTDTIIYDELKSATTFAALRGNPFRLSNARIDGNSRQINSTLNALKVKVELGDSPTHSFAPNNIDEDAVRHASQIVKDPVKRLIAECLWFWPLEQTQSDAALEAINNGNPSEAITIWTQTIPNAHWGPIAKHNLGLIALFNAVEISETYLSNPKYKLDTTQFISYWSEVSEYLNELIDSLAIEDYLRNRIRELNDPRLSPRTASTLQAMLIQSIGQIAAQVAILFHNRNNRASEQVVVCAERLCGSSMSDCIDEILKSEIEYIQNFIQSPPKGDPRTIWKDYLARLVTLYEKLDIFLSQDIKLKKQDLANASARRLRSYAVECANDHDDYATSLKILTTLKPIVTGEELSKINEDLKIVEKLHQESLLVLPVKPIIDKINELHKYISKDIKWRACGRKTVDNLILKGQEILKEIENLSTQNIAANSIDKACIELAKAYNDFALEANNQVKDYGAAYLLLEFALSFRITDASLTTTLQKGIYTIRKNYDIALKNQKDHNVNYLGTRINDFSECIQRSFVFGIIGAIAGGVISQHPAGAITCGIIGAIVGFLFRP